MSARRPKKTATTKRDRPSVREATTANNSAWSPEKNGCRSPKRSQCKRQVLEIRAPKKALLQGFPRGWAGTVALYRHVFLAPVPPERQAGYRAEEGRRADDVGKRLAIARHRTDVDAMDGAGRPTHDDGRPGDGGWPRWGICSYPRTGGWHCDYAVPEINLRLPIQSACAAGPYNFVRRTSVAGFMSCYPDNSASAGLVAAVPGLSLYPDILPPPRRVDVKKRQIAIFHLSSNSHESTYLSFLRRLLFFPKILRRGKVPILFRRGWSGTLIHYHALQTPSGCAKVHRCRR